MQLVTGTCLWLFGRSRESVFAAALRNATSGSFHVTFSSKKRSPTAHCHWLPETISFLHLLQNHGFSRLSTAVLLLYVRHLPSAPFHTGLKAFLSYTCALTANPLSRISHHGSSLIVSPFPSHARPLSLFSSISEQINCGFSRIFIVS
jgi:hypothetical protein